MNKALVFGLLAACGGMDLPVCPTGDCTLPGRTVVKWGFDVYPELLFAGDTCQDMGAQTVRVDLTGIDDPTQFDTKDIDCNQHQASFLGLAAGNYSASLTVLDAGGNPIVKTSVVVPTVAGTPDTESTVTVNVPYTAWTATYTGTFLFRLSWSGKSCETAVPAVANQTLTLMVGGVPASTLTDVGQKLDGSDPKPCRQLGEPFAQFAEGLPFGPATLTVIGEDSLNTPAFEKTIDTFIGAAKNNPTITFDITPPPP